MTTTELRAAAERLMVDGALDVPIPVLWDITRVARYVLSLHPADDDTPISEEWLRSIGFVDDCGDLTLMHDHAE